MPATILSTKYLCGWPPRQGKTAAQLGVGPELDQAINTRWETDAHFTAYRGIGCRLNSDALTPLAVASLPDGGAYMDYAVFDVDGPGHRATAEWRAAQDALLPTLWERFPGFVQFSTRGGYRLVWRLDAPVKLASLDDAARWSAWYELQCATLESLGVLVDRACKDWTRCYRLPFVVRDDEPQQSVVRGDLNAGAWPVGVMPELPPRPEYVPRGAPGEHDDLDFDPVVNIVAPYFTYGARHAIARALGAYLCNRGYGELEAAELVFAIALAAGSNDPDARADDAVSSFRDRTPKGWSALREFLPESALKSLEGLIPDLMARALAGAAAPVLAPTFIAPPLAQHEPVGREDLEDIRKKWGKSKKTDENGVARILTLALAPSGQPGLAPGDVQYLGMAADLAVALGRAFPRSSVERITALVQPALEIWGVSVDEFGALVRDTQREAQARSQDRFNRANAAAEVQLPPIVYQQNTCWVRSETSEDYHWQCSRSDLRGVLAEAAPSITLIRETENGGRSLVPVDDLLLFHGKPVKDQMVRYAQRNTCYDGADFRLVRGLRYATREPKFHEAIHNYLCALVSATKENEQPIRDLYEWIAACRQDRLNVPAAILTLIGPPSVGKTLLAYAMAHCQGVPEPVSGKCLTRQFQSELTETNILLFDEEFPRDLDQAELSEQVSKGARRVEGKGIDKKIQVVGCLRMIVTANSVERLHLNGSSGPAAMRALAERLAVFMIPDAAEESIKAALRPLLTKNGRVDFDEFVEHFFFVMDNYHPRAQRFLGAREDKQIATAVVAASDAAKHASVLDSIQHYLESSGNADRYYIGSDWRSAPDSNARQQGARKCYPIIVRNKHVVVDPATLAAALDVDIEKVNKAIKPLKVEGPRSDGVIRKQRVVGYALNTKALFAALPDLDLAAAEETLSTDTRYRLPDQGPNNAPGAPQ